MSTFTSASEDQNRVTWFPNEDRIQVTGHEDGSFTFATLSAKDRRALAFELLEEDYDVEASFFSGEYTLKPKLEKRAKVGEFYRVKSTPNMVKQYRYNPIVRVVSVEPSGFFRVETPSGYQMPWNARKDNLEGPLEVEERTVWIEAVKEA